MKKLFLVFLLLLNPLVAFADINECKTDVYFANGILTKQQTAIDYAYLLELAIIDLLEPEAFTQKIGKVHYAYNETHGWILDPLETIYQKTGFQGLLDKFIKTSHSKDLSKQIKSYKESIKAGHNVLVVAHSQGNLFTHEAYKGLSDSEKKHFEAVSVASPMSADIKDATTRVDWDNDIVPRIATFGLEFPLMISNDVRKVNWKSNNVFGVGKPDSNYVTKSNLGDTYKSRGYSYTAEENGLNTAVHAFTFYMGETLKDSDDKTEIINPFTGETLRDTTAKQRIMNAVNTKLRNLCNCSDMEAQKPESGIIGISLRWADAEVAMNLSSEIGIKDITSSKCSAFEHYHVKSEDDVEPGTYGVYVTNSGGVNDSYLPQSISLNIHAPGAAMVFDFEITATDMLNLGHVADIIITEDNKSKVIVSQKYKNATKCYGECQGSGSSGTYQQYIYEVLSRLKQALLGPLSGAGVTLTQAEGFLNNTAFYESSTSAGNSLLTSGLFYFTQDVIESLEPDRYYVMSVIGGDDIDANDDGILDPIPTKNEGTIRAVVDSDVIEQKNFKVNILTEIAFQVTQEMMTEDLNTTTLREKLDEVALRLLIEDVDGDGEIDYNDILAWLPTGDKDKLRKPYDQYYEPIVQKIYKDEAIYDEAYAVVYEPYYRASTLRVDDNATDDFVVGKVEVELLDSDMTYSFVEESDIFEIMSDGTIVVKDSSMLQHSLSSWYELSVIATNGIKTTAPFVVRININRTNKPPVFVSPSHRSINENQIEAITLEAVDPDGDALTYSISGTDSESFDIDSTSGVVTFKVAPDYDSDKKVYRFKAAVSDGIHITYQDVMIQIITQPTEIKILSVVYDDNRTANVDDDILYIYFNKDIDPDSITQDIGANYKINGVGKIGSASRGVYENDLFYRHTIYLNNEGTQSVVFDLDTDTIEVAAHTLRDRDGKYVASDAPKSIKRFLGVLQTGQTMVYTPNDDGAYQKGLSRDFTRENDIVTDHVTRLQWQDNSVGSATNWQTAIDRCEDLALGGYTDWRLPTIEELQTIVDLRRRNPAMDSVFEKFASSFYWSSTPDASGASYAWFVLFSSGRSNFSFKGNSNYVRCVRGGGE